MEAPRLATVCFPAVALALICNSPSRWGGYASSRLDHGLEVQLPNPPNSLKSKRFAALYQQIVKSREHNCFGGTLIQGKAQWHQEGCDQVGC